MRGEWRVVAAFGVSILASIAFAVALFLGGPTPLMGALLALALAGIGIGLVSWADDVLPPSIEREHREPLDSTAEEEAAFVSDFGAAGRATTRRRLLGGLLGGALGGVVAALILPLRSLSRVGGEALFTTSWAAGMRLVTSEDEPIHVDSLPEGGALTAFPEGRTEAFDSTVILVRVGPDDLSADRREGAPNGYIAYSKICTHAGCPVGMYDPDSALLTCPCHHSSFRVLEDAQPNGGPAGRPLPRLPLAVDESGFLVAASGFDRPVGPGFWEANQQ